MPGRLSTIWLALVLPILLGFMILGELPHRHGAARTALTIHGATATPGIDAAVAGDADDGHCPLCLAYATSGAGAAPNVSGVCLPAVAAQLPPAATGLMSHLLPIASASRAPPPSLA